VEEDIYKSVEKEFEEFEGKKAKGKKEKEEEESSWGGLKPRYYTNDEGEFVPNRSMRFVRFFVKAGPYEPVFFERLSKMYFRASGFYFKQMVDVIKNAMGIE
jgi:hypothetical protein